VDGLRDAFHLYPEEFANHVDALPDQSLSISHRWNEEHLLDLMLGDRGDEPYEDTLERMEEEWGEWWTRTSFGRRESWSRKIFWAEVILMTRETAFLMLSEDPGDTF
jgi:hypothetical protein